MKHDSFQEETVKSAWFCNRRLQDACEVLGWSATGNSFLADCSIKIYPFACLPNFLTPVYESFGDGQRVLLFSSDWCDAEKTVTTAIS